MEEPQDEPPSAFSARNCASCIFVSLCVGVILLFVGIALVCVKVEGLEELLPTGIFLIVFGALLIVFICCCCNMEKKRSSDDASTTGGAKDPEAQNEREEQQPQQQDRLISSPDTAVVQKIVDDIEADVVNKSGKDGDLAAWC